MLEHEIPQLAETALAAILDANAAIMKIYAQGDLTIDFKADHSPVTQADLQASEIIYKHLEKTGLPIICEEKGQADYHIRRAWDWYWMVDPLDGTKEFISRNGEFTINIALIHKDTPKMGFIAIPVKDQLYWGDYLSGAYKTSISANHKIDYDSLLSGASKLPLEKPNDQFKIVVSRSHMDDETNLHITRLRQRFPMAETIPLGSSIKFCHIAEGTADIYFRFSSIMEWDTAAGQAIVTAAGAKVLSLPAKDSLVYNKPELRNGAFLVCRDLHTDLF